MYATFMSQKHKQMRQKGRGVSLPYARPQNPFTTTKNPLDFSGEKANTRKFPKLNKEGTKEAKHGLRGGGWLQTQKWPYWNFLNIKN